MIEIDYKEFNAISNRFVNKPFEITNAWAEYQVARGGKVLFFVDSIDQPQILSWSKIKRVKFIGDVLEVQGPIYNKNVTTKQLCKFLEGYKELPFKAVFLNLSTEYDVAFEVACRVSSFKRPIGQSNTSLTILVNTDTFNPNRSWKRNFKKASKENFKIDIKHLMSKTDCDVVEKLHEENARIKNLGYKLHADQIKILTESDNIYTCFLYKNETPIAARIISIEEDISYDIFACNSLESRNNGATQFLMQSIFEHLKNKGVTFFDFSRIPIGRKGASGVYEFKNATRGDVIQYNGEWVFFKNKWLRHLYYFYNVVINKKDFY